LGIEQSEVVRSTESQEVMSQWLTKSSGTIWDGDTGATRREKPWMGFINEHAACSALEAGKVELRVQS
jgi:hypothetical protein